MGLVYKPISISAGHIAKCKMFLDAFFSLCGDLPDVDAHEVYLLRKHQSVVPLSQPHPTWTCLDLLTPSPGIQDSKVSPGAPAYHSSSLTFRLMTANEHYLTGAREVGYTTILATPNSLIETVAPSSYESLLRISSTASIAHTGNPVNTCQGLGSVQSE